MASVPCVVRYLIACEDVVVQPDRLNQATLVNLISAIRSLDDPPFPLTYPEFCVYVQLTECRGTCRFRVEIVEDDTDRIAFRTRTRVLSFANDPLIVHGLSFRIRNCMFPAAGLYWIQFWYEDKLANQQPLLLR